MELNTLWQNLVAAFLAWFTAWSAAHPDFLTLIQQYIPALGAKTAE
jgi:hypothetical protein